MGLQLLVEISSTNVPEGTRHDLENDKRTHHYMHDAKLTVRCSVMIQFEWLRSVERNFHLFLFERNCAIDLELSIRPGEYEIQWYAPAFTSGMRIY